MVLKGTKFTSLSSERITFINKEEGGDTKGNYERKDGITNLAT